VKKIPKPVFTTEFKELAVNRVKDFASISSVVKELGIGDQTLRNWVKAVAQGKLKGGGNKVVTSEAMELSRLWVEMARLQRDNEIIKKAAVGSTGHCNSSDLMAFPRRTQCQELVGLGCQPNERKRYGAIGKMANR
jgi:transposase